MDYGQLQRFALRHGSVSIADSQGNTRILPSGEPDTHERVAKADRFLWDGLLRSLREMEELVAQSERGLVPGCKECERLEKELIRARERDREEKNLEQKYELRALGAFKDHRISHQ